MSLGSVIGQDYTLPGVPGYQAGGFIGPSQAEQAAEQAQFAPAQGQAILPGLDAELAQIEGMTDEYYDTYSKLKSYVTEMNRLGIDVTKPDFTKPGGGDEFKTYKMFEAGLLRTANQLKNEYKKRQQLEPMFAKDQLRNVEGFDPTKQLYTETPDAYFSTELSPRTSSALKLATDPTYTKTDWDRQKGFVKAEIDNLNNQIANEQRADVKAKLAYERDQLVQAFQKTDMTLLRQTQRDKTSGVGDKDLGLIKKIEALRLGGLEDGKYQLAYDKSGKVSAYNEELQGFNYGQVDINEVNKNNKPTGKTKTVNRVVKGIRAYPDGRVLLEFQNDEYGNPISPEIISDQDGGVVLSKFLKNNQSAFGSPAKILEALNKAGYLDETGNLDSRALFGGAFEDIGNRSSSFRQKLSSADQNAVNMAKNDLTNALVGVPSYFNVTPSDKGKVIELQTPAGVKRVEIRQGSRTGKYYIKNASEFGLKSSSAFTFDELFNELQSRGLFDNYLTIGGEQPVTNTSGGPSLDDPNNPLNQP